MCVIWAAFFNKDHSAQNSNQAVTPSLLSGETIRGGYGHQFP